MGISEECIAVRLIIISIGLPFSSFGILVTKNNQRGVLFSISLSYAAKDLFHKIVKLVDNRDGKFHSIHRKKLLYISCIKRVIGIRPQYTGLGNKLYINILNLEHFNT